jgi:hypothetical protein
MFLALSAEAHGFMFRVEIPFRVTVRRFSDSLCRMANGLLRAGKPKALHAVARQRLLLINGLLDEVSRNYVARLHREIVALTRVLEISARDGTAREKDLRGILKKIEQLHIDPERGRRKDLKKIDSLIGQIQAVVEGW